MITMMWAAVALASVLASHRQDEELLDPRLIAEVLEQTAAAAQLPQQLDPTTKLVDVRASGMSLTYHYETSEVVSEAGLRRFFAQNNVPAICADEDTRWSFRQGVLFRYHYVFTATATKPVLIEVGATDCGDVAIQRPIPRSRNPVIRPPDPVEGSKAPRRFDPSPTRWR